jgi:predicted enzyme related to lactoylglutathione lyase
MADRFVWYELMTSDAASAGRFYREVVGWEVEALGGAHQGYALFKADRPVAGLMDLPAEACKKGARPGWLGYVGVADTDAAARRIAEAGGSVLRDPGDIPEVGRFAVVADPGGAVFMLLTPEGESAPSEGAKPLGHVDWHELLAADGDPAFHFYSGQFSWTEHSRLEMGPKGVYLLWSYGGGEPVGGMMTKPDEAPSPYWNFYFRVERVATAADRIAAEGGRVFHGPMQVPGGDWVVMAADPQGAPFSLVSRGE